MVIEFKSGFRRIDGISKDNKRKWEALDFEQFQSISAADDGSSRINES